MRVRVAIAIAFLVGLGGCRGVGSYLCAADADCDLQASGICLNDSACAYPVSSDVCPSGLARSPEASVEPGACVTDSPATDSASDAGSLSGVGSDSSSDSTSGPQDCWSTEFDVDLAPFVKEGEDGSFAGYPLLVRLTDPELVDAAGQSRLTITSTSGESLSFERAPGDPADALDLWVKLPSDAEGPTSLRIVGDPSQPAVFARAVDVWEAYRSVWQLDDEVTGDEAPRFENRLTPAEPLTVVEGLAPEQSVPGVIGRAVSLDGVDDVLTGNTSDWGRLESFTVSGWVRQDGPEVRDTTYLFSSLNGDGVYPMCLRRSGGEVDCLYRLFSATKEAVDEREDPTSEDTPGMQQLGFYPGHLVPPGRWFHIAFSRDAATGTARMLLDGLEDSLQEPTTYDDFVLSSANSEMRIGGRLPAWHHPLSLDEFRITNRALPSPWLRADAGTQSDPARFITESADGLAAVACPK